MDVLESQLEAIFFINHLSFDFLTILASSLWTWVAVLTATVSLWKIRAVGVHVHSPQTKSDASLLSFHEQQIQEELQKPIIESVQHRSCNTCTTSVLECEVDGVTKGKFVMYFKDNADDEISTEAQGIDEENIYSCVKDVRSFEGCEVMFVKRSWDLGWYRYQDLTIFDGNVVKLWDDDRRPGMFFVS